MSTLEMVTGSYFIVHTTHVWVVGELCGRETVRIFVHCACACATHVHLFMHGGGVQTWLPAVHCAVDSFFLCFYHVSRRQFRTMYHV